jgi:hypothetical protein
MKKKIGIHFIPYVVLMAILLLCMVLTAGKVSASDFSDENAEEGKYIEEDQVKPQPPVITDFKINNDSILGYGDRINISFKISNRTYNSSDPDKKTFVGQFFFTYKKKNITDLSNVIAVNLFYNPKSKLVEGTSNVLDESKSEGIYYFYAFFDQSLVENITNVKNTKISNTTITFCEDCKNGKHRIDTIKYKEPTYKDYGYSNCQKCRICGTVISGKVLNPIKPYCKPSTTNVTMYANQIKKFQIKHAKGDNVVDRTHLNGSIYIRNICLKKGDKSDIITIQPYNKIGKETVELILKSGLKAKINITVKPAKTQKIYGVKKNITIKVGKKYTLKPKISPSYSSDKITYSSNNKKVVAVNSKGLITPRKKGTAYITIKSGSKYVKCRVTVK